MKNFVINESSLAIRDVLPVSIDGWKAFKLSHEQAMRFNFDDEGANFSQLVEKYGSENMLSEGEHYEGYIVLCSFPVNILVKIFSYAERVKDANLFFAPQSIKMACNNGNLYRICFEHGGKKSYNGGFRYVWPLGVTPFEKVTTCEEAVKLRNKLVEACVNKTSVSISDREETILRQFLGDYFSKFFRELI